MIRFAKILPAICVFATLACFACAQEKESISLPFNPPVGSTTLYRLEQTSSQHYESSSETPSPSRPLSSRVSLVLEQKVRERLADNTLILQYYIRQFDFRQTAENLPDSNVPSPRAKALEGTTVTLTLSPEGEVSDFQGPPDARQVNLPELLKSFSLRDILPQRKVKVGETWTTKLSEHSQRGPVLMLQEKEFTTTLLGVEDKNGSRVARLSVKMELSQKPAPEAAAKHPDVELTQDGVSKGEVLFDFLQGRILSESIDARMSVRASRKNPTDGKDAKPQTVSSIVEVTVRLEAISSDDSATTTTREIM